MKLLFDENLSPKLSRLLQDLYPGSRHARALNLRRDYYGLWDYAKEYDFCIVTKDGDFRDLSDRYGPPPKAVLIRLGNGPARDVEILLRERYADLLALDQDESRGLLELP